MRSVVTIMITTLFLLACSGTDREQKTIIPGGLIPVKLIPLRVEAGHQVIEASGLLSTESEARLSFKIGGVIEQVLVKEGDKVKKGQVLATLKSTEIEAQVQLAGLSLEKAERDYQRVKNLFKDSVATLEQLQNAKTGSDIARQNLEQVRFNQRYSKIYAPADGFIVKKFGNPGELAGPGSTVLFMNTSPSPGKWILKLGLPDQEWAGVKTGYPASVTIDAFPAKIFKGVVSKKALSADPVTGSFTVEVQVSFGEEQPATGMFGKASIYLPVTTNGYSINYEALLEANGKKGFVFVSDDEKTVQKVEVTIASISNDKVYISSGLEGHRFLVNSGSPYLDEHALIQPVK